MSERTGPAEPELVQRLAVPLAAIVGPDNVLLGEGAEEFRLDALAPWRGYRDFAKLALPPIVVARPKTTEEISTVVRLADETGVTVVPYGGGSGLMGGVIAARPAVVIDLKRMDAIIEIDRENHTARAQAGVVLETLELALNEEGLILGHDPWSLPIATVGGAISTDSLGYRGAKYGSMGDQVLGLTAVLPNGDVFERRTAAKISVGPDLRRLFVGGEGCFGIVTEATLRVFPAPERRWLRAFRFGRFDEGFAAIVEMNNVGLVPALLDYGGRPAPDGALASATLYLGFEGTREQISAEKRRARRICEDAGGLDLGGAEARRFWKLRHDVARGFAERRRRDSRGRSTAPAAFFDFVHVTLPTTRVLDYRAACGPLLEGRGVRPAEYGIWCWPQLFSVVMTSDGDDGRERLADGVDGLLSLALDMDGSIEYCHGVGLRLAHFMEREHGRGLDLMRSVKRALDPQGILNPGKLRL